MTSPIAAMTKLDAVNSMLASIGQSPLNTIVGQLPIDGSKAVIALDTALREVLNKGWSFNSDTEYLLTPSSGKIDIPSNAAYLDPSCGENYTARYDTSGTPGMRVYDNDDRSFDQFGTESVKFDIVWLFEFEQIPQHARSYVAAKAGRAFQTGIIASQVLYEFTSVMEREAYATFRRVEKRTQDFNINKNSVAINRRRNPTRW